MSGEPASSGAVAPPERRLPPIAEAAIAAMALALVGAIYLASYLPDRPPFGPAIGLLAAAGVLLLACVVMLSRLRGFAWGTFFVVCRWSVVGYLVIAGMLEYVFVRNDTRGTPLVLMTLMLALYAVAVPLLFAFSVAKYQRAGGTADDR